MRTNSPSPARPPATGPPARRQPSMSQLRGRHRIGQENSATGDCRGFVLRLCREFHVGTGRRPQRVEGHGEVRSVESGCTFTGSLCGTNRRTPPCGSAPVQNGWEGQAKPRGVSKRRPPAWLSVVGQLGDGLPGAADSSLPLMQSACVSRHFFFLTRFSAGLFGRSGARLPVVAGTTIVLRAGVAGVRLIMSAMPDAGNLHLGDRLRGQDRLERCPRPARDVWRRSTGDGGLMKSSRGWLLPPRQILSRPLAPREGHNPDNFFGGEPGIAPLAWMQVAC